MPQDRDRRQEPRAAIELEVEYQRLNSFFYDYTKNISKGGTFIRTKKPLGLGTRFLFKLVVPTLSEPLRLVGEVRWAHREGDAPRAGESAGEPGMGIRFLFDDESQRSQVDEVVERLMVSSLGQLIYSRLRSLTPA